MSKHRLMLFVALGAVVAINLLDRRSMEYSDANSNQRQFIEYASILWKARVYTGEIEFLSSNQVLHTTSFEVGEKHVQSIVYRNLNGYFDPVLVTVWRRGQNYKALIIDPVKQLDLLRVDATTEIDVSVSHKNKILFAYTKPESGKESRSSDQIVTWPSETKN